MIYSKMIYNSGMFSTTTQWTREVLFNSFMQRPIFMKMHMHVSRYPQNVLLH